MSIKNKLIEDLKWFRKNGLIKRTFITLIMTLIEMFVLAILNFRDHQIMAIGIISFIGFFFIVYLFFAWVFSDEQPINKSEKMWIKEEVEDLVILPSTELPKEEEKVELTSLNDGTVNSDIKALHSIFAFFVLAVMILSGLIFKYNDTKAKVEIKSSPTSNDYQYFNEINQRQYPSNSSINEKNNDDKFYSIEDLKRDLEKPQTKEQLLQNPYKVTPRNQVEQENNSNIYPNNNEENNMFEYQEKFRIGSKKNEVKRIQGEPRSVLKLYGNEEVWYYGILTSVTFKNGKVYQYDNSDGILKVEY